MGMVYRMHHLGGINRGKCSRGCRILQTEGLAVKHQFSHLSWVEAGVAPSLLKIFVLL